MPNTKKRSRQNLFRFSPMKIRNLVAIFSFVVIIAFLFFWSYQFFQLIFIKQNEIFITTAVSAFAGAFFAFTFLRIGSALGKYYEQQKRHYNALVALEILLNEIGGIVHDNILLLPDFRKVISSGNVYTSLQRPISLEKSYYKKLHDIDLINELYRLNYDIRRINDDIENTNVWYLHLRDLYTSGKIKPKHYIENAKILSDGLKIIEASQRLFLKDVLRLLAIVKIRAELDKPLLMKLIHYIIDTTRTDINEDQIKLKTKQTQKEVDESAEKSKNKIKKILEKVNSME